MLTQKQSKKFDRMIFENAHSINDETDTIFSELVSSDVTDEVPILQSNIVVEKSLQDIQTLVLPLEESLNVETSEHTTEIIVDVSDQHEQGQLGIWAARALLLLVAAIWGTNFAV